jgi:hypothetical protein
MPDMLSSVEQPAKAIAATTAAGSKAVRKMFGLIEDLFLRSAGGQAHLKLASYVQ